MAVTTLLDLKHKSTLPLERGCAMDVSIRDGIAAPGIHVRTPGGELGKMSKGAEADRGHEHRDYCNGSAFPALLSFSGKKWQKNQANNYQRRDDEKKCRLERWRK